MHNSCEGVEKVPSRDCSHQGEFKLTPQPTRCAGSDESGDVPAQRTDQSQV
jgi:hypothetical protein